jgi:hypothetical protein
MLYKSITVAIGFCCLQLFADNITNLYRLEPVYVGMPLTTVPSAAASCSTLHEAANGTTNYDGSGIYKYLLTYMWASNNYSPCAIAVPLNGTPQTHNTNQFRVGISTYPIALDGSLVGSWSSWKLVSSLPSTAGWVTNSCCNSALTSGTLYVIVVQSSYQSGGDYIGWFSQAGQYSASRFRYSTDGTDNSAINSYTAQYLLLGP